MFLGYLSSYRWHDYDKTNMSFSCGIVSVCLDEGVSDHMGRGLSMTNPMRN